MLFCLVRIRILSARNVVAHSVRNRPAVAAAVTLLGVGLFAAVYAGFLLFFEVARRIGVEAEALRQVLFFLFLFLLAGSVPFVASTLLQSGDYELLFASPAPPSSIVAAKLLDATVSNSLQFLVLGVPAICAVATVLTVPPWMWLLMPLVIGLFVLIPALITALVLLVLMWMLGARRVRASIALMNTVMALGVCSTMVIEAAHLPTRTSVGAAFPPYRTAAAVQPSAAASIAPSHWFADALIAVHSQSVEKNTAAASSLLDAAVCTGLLYLACTLLGSRLLTASNLSVESERRTYGGGAAQSRTAAAVLGVLPPQVAAIVAKDLRYLLRDTILKSQLTMPLILFLVPLPLALSQSVPQMRDELFPFAIGMTVIILFMQTSILSLSSIGLESRGFWILLSAPLPAVSIVLAKVAMSTLVTGGVAALLILVSGLIFRPPLIELFVIAAGAVTSAAALCGLGVGISAALPRFVYENPAHRVSAWALILGFFASTGYIVIAGTIFGTAWLLAANSVDARIVYGAAAALYAALTVGVALLPGAIGAKRLQEYEWDQG